MIGKGLHELDLLFRKRLHDTTHQGDHADRHSVADQRDAERRAVLANLLVFENRVLRIGEAIRNMNRAAFECRPTDQRSASRPEWICAGIVDEFLLSIVRRRDPILPVP